MKPTLPTLLALPLCTALVGAPTGCSDAMEPVDDPCAAVANFGDCFQTEGCWPAIGDDITFTEPDGQSCYFADTERPTESSAYFHCRSGEIGNGDDPQYVINPETGACLRFYAESELPPEGWEPCADTMPACVLGDCPAINDEETCDMAIGCDSGTGYDSTGMAPDGSLCYMYERSPGAVQEFFWCYEERPTPSPVIAWAMNPDDGHCYEFVNPYGVPPDWLTCEGNMPMCK